MKALTLFHYKVKVLTKFIAFPTNGAVFTIVLNTSSSLRLRFVRKAALRLDKLTLKKRHTPPPLSVGIPSTTCLVRRKIF